MKSHRAVLPIPALVAGLLLAGCGTGETAPDAGETPSRPPVRPSGDPTPTAAASPTTSPTASPTAGPATSPTPTPSDPPAVDPPPGDFPLAAGWPVGQEEVGSDLGLRGPSSTLREIEYAACDRALDVPATAGSLRARWSTVEDYRSRELLTLTDADAAVGLVGDVVAFYRSCPEESGSGQTLVTTVRQTGVGGQSYAISRRRVDNRTQSPAVGLDTIHVVRLGRAVLIDTTANEAGAGPDPAADQRRVVAAMVAGSGDVVAAMCRFTEVGC